MMFLLIYINDLNDVTRILFLEFIKFLLNVEGKIFLLKEQRKEKQGGNFSKKTNRIHFLYNGCSKSTEIEAVFTKAGMKRKI